MMSAPELPEHFDDVEVLLILRNGSYTQLRHQYPLTCGLVSKLRTALIRVLKRSLLKGHEVKALSTEDVTLYTLIEAFTSEKEFLRTNWPEPMILHSVVVEISVKSINLSPPLQRELCLHPLGGPKYIKVQGVPGVGMKTTPVELNGIKYALANMDLRGCNTETGEFTRVSIHFNKDFLLRVKDYHEATQRPPGTFEDPSKTSPVKSPIKAVAVEDVSQTDGDEACNSNYIHMLAALPKETCVQCKGHRQIYCGTCSGRRMPDADQQLPPRVHIPFDVLLLVHWAETLHKCTGVHVGALCEEGTFLAMDWNKKLVPTVPLPLYNQKYASKDNSQSAEKVSNSENSQNTTKSELREEWQQVVESLDHTRDVVLFPCDTAQQAEAFPWSECPHIHHIDIAGETEGEEEVVKSQETHPKDVEPARVSPRWRLVVLEANWNYGKHMALQIRQHRALLGLPPLHFVQLSNITGQYWKFQTEGHAAVSTIEAIAHTAGAAGCSSDTVDAMLTLFLLQKHRVLKRIEMGGKVPRAVEVSGAGLGSWKDLTDSLTELE
eukprot:CAMPEP_0184994894 /NCGR_PEP_ID=MMETSP1098-20130426/51083_1 /TAXON_ID=89044 /ORGANISM="Spumella elongata, Strain CCAP 955/1" /LENGTH=549 /DNA_ID=CAMNT_0027521055 /DNA_START=20 /DNA_END=1669 /DNA_ORIENTATION=+